MKTTTIFRTFPSGEVIALFPEEPAETRNPWTFMSYQHVGQHGAAGHCVVQSTRPATVEEYAPLKQELEALGYDLSIRHKITGRMDANRQNQHFLNNLHSGSV